MKKQKKHLPGPVIELAIVALLAVLVWIFVDVNVEGIARDTAGSCLSVVFDKPLLKGVDRVVIYEEGQVITLTDPETVRQIADLFAVANCTDLCNPGSRRRLEIYNGDRLVRYLPETQCGSGLYYCYERDLFHWVFPSDCGTGEVQLSNEAQQWLDRIIAENG